MPQLLAEVGDWKSREWDTKSLDAKIATELDWIWQSATVVDKRSTRIPVKEDYD